MLEIRLKNNKNKRMDLMLNMPLHPFVCSLHPSPAENQLCSAAIPSCALCTSTGPSLEQDTALAEGVQARAPGLDSCISQFSSLRFSTECRDNCSCLFGDVEWQRAQPVS